jgi:hypothetical protein
VLGNPSGAQPAGGAAGEWGRLSSAVARKLGEVLPRFRYRGSAAGAASFPLGGTGCIGFAANGRLVDWEIFNRPSKGGLNGFTRFAAKAEAEGRVLDARVLVGDQSPPYSGGSGASSSA